MDLLETMENRESDTTFCSVDGKEMLTRIHQPGKIHFKH